MTEISPTPYSELVSLIRQASYASDAIDYFDLNGDDPAMQATWKWFLAQHRDSVLALVKHIATHEAEIIAALGAPIEGAPVEPPPATLAAPLLADWVYAAVTHYAIVAEHATKDANLHVDDPNSLPLPLIRRWFRVNRKK